MELQLRRSTNAVSGPIGDAERPRDAELPNAAEPAPAAAGVALLPALHAATKAVTRPARSIGFSCCFSIKALQLKHSNSFRALGYTTGER
jgi:hypothetical protein